MSDKTLEIYAERARLIEDDTVATGRTVAVRGLESVIRRDVMAKLDLAPHDRLLDIGSGIGELAIPLSYFCQSVAVVDHPVVLERLMRSARPNIRALPGNYFDVELGGTFTKALAYSMTHYLDSVDRILEMIDKTLAHLEHGGLFLIGDLPNDAYRVRMVSTEQGQRTIMDWSRRMLLSESEKLALESVLQEPRDDKLVEISDPEVAVILAHVHDLGHNARVLAQVPMSLGGRHYPMPFGHQRHDILIEKLQPAPRRDMFVAMMNDGRALGFSIRKVLPSDCDMLYVWSQDPSVRAASIRTEEFTIEHHREWFARKMESKDCAWYILEEGVGNPIGQARYERVVAGRPLWTGGPNADKTDGAEISVSIVPSARMANLAKPLLERSGDLAKQALGADKLIALIKPENTSSLRAFEKAGYKRVGEEERMGVSLVRYEK